jgi:NAD(P)-dependent dehydrogenase (short-subunit alcohol dehydrogenase family)
MRVASGQSNTDKKSFLQWEFLRQLSEDQDNIVVGIVRNKASTDKRVAEELRERSNITIVEADLTNFNSIRVGTPMSTCIRSY